MRVCRENGLKPVNAILKVKVKFVKTILIELSSEERGCSLYFPVPRCSQGGAIPLRHIEIRICGDNQVIGAVTVYIRNSEAVRITTVRCNCDCCLRAIF